MQIPILRALWQRPTEVVVRDPGDRFLSAPRPIGPYAKEHWQFAWLSVVAYAKTPGAVAHARSRLTKIKATATNATAQAEADNIDGTAETRLAAAGWSRWQGFPDDGLSEKIAATHLRVEVWERKDPAAVAVTFGGTVFNNDKDWRANLRWFLPGHRDEYTDVVQTLAPAFAPELRQRWPQGVALFSTGHSLGGGLAQQFAYSVPLGSIKVVKVYAFDPSPVTGFLSVERRLRDENKKGLLIDRIYERGEILAILRSLTSLFWRPTEVNAAIRGVRYALFRSWNAIGAHSIPALAQGLDAAAQ
jgi:hypothetical protein